ncbi:MAG: AEC family transporter, partial [Lachnospiraceae bacterium]|nr:AEC family transporter [Lachnospiraceae bacterium]
MLSLLLAERIVQLFVIMALGFVIVKSGLLKSSDSVVLSKVVLYVVVPCTILNIFQIDLTDDIRNGIFLAFAVVIFLHFVAIFIGYSFRKLFAGSVVEEMSVVYPNAGNLMIPLISYIMG